MVEDLKQKVVDVADATTENTETKVKELADQYKTKMDAAEKERTTDTFNRSWENALTEIEQGKLTDAKTKIEARLNATPSTLNEPQKTSLNIIKETLEKKISEKTPSGESNSTVEKDEPTSASDVGKKIDKYQNDINNVAKDLSDSEKMEKLGKDFQKFFESLFKGFASFLQGLGLAGGFRLGKQSIEAPKNLTPTEKTDQLLTELSSDHLKDNEKLQENKDLLDQAKALLTTTPLTQEHITIFQDAIKKKF
jgi:hypothetical protein